MKSESEEQRKAAELEALKSVVLQADAVKQMETPLPSFDWRDETWRDETYPSSVKEVAEEDWEISWLPVFLQRKKGSAVMLCMPRKSEASKKEEHKELNSKSDLPKWQPEPDQPSSLEKFIRYCRTEKCSNFQAGHCELHKPKMQCFNFHFEGQRRRSPLGADGTLQYWELPCKWISQSSKCPRGDQCTLAHSKGEISYHPAKYKTRVCNGSDCQKATCCFAHSDKDINAAARYSHHSASGLKDVPEETEENWDEAPGQSQKPILKRKPTVDLSTFKVFPCRKSRGIQHDRKLCPFFHNPRDRRRPPGTYSAEPCDECFDSMAEQREGATSSRSSCSRGDSCRFCHNRPELLYHESVFKRRFCATFPKAVKRLSSKTGVKKTDVFLVQMCFISCF
eukprot:g18865.t1